LSGLDKIFLEIDAKNLDYFSDSIQIEKDRKQYSGLFTFKIENNSVLSLSKEEEKIY
jgi:hypothetical protein